MRIFYVLTIAALQITVAPEVVLQVGGVNAQSVARHSALPTSAAAIDQTAQNVTVVYKG